MGIYILVRRQLSSEMRILSKLKSQRQCIKTGDEVSDPLTVAKCFGTQANYGEISGSELYTMLQEQ